MNLDFQKIGLLYKLYTNTSKLFVFILFTKLLLEVGSIDIGSACRPLYPRRLIELH